MSKRLRSACWDHFKKENENAICLVGQCTARIKHSGNTSNLLKHLKICHPEEYQKCIPAQESRNKKSKSADSVASTSKQITISETMSLSRKYPSASVRSKTLDNALIEMIATDLQPISIVEDKGFLKYTSLLDPRYEPPSRRTLTRRLLPEKYQEVKKSLEQKLAEIPSLALTTDIWSSNQGMSYCCLTAHSISKSWELESFVLETFNFNKDHTGQNIANELNRVVAEWGSPNISCCVTDNASNMVSGIEKAGWNHLPCFAHTLNLVVQDAINADPALSNLKEKCKEIVSHFHRSTKASEKLRAIQKQLNMPELKLIQDVVTRWNSTYLMLERIISQHEAITTTLCLLDKAVMCLSSEEKVTISQSLLLLKPFFEATEDISGDKYVSISLIIPLTKLLLKAASSGPDIPLRSLLVRELTRRFSQIEQRYTIAVSTLLDPRFKKLTFADTSAVEQAVRRLKEDVLNLIPTPEETEDQTEVECHSSTGLWATFDEKVSRASSHRTDTTDGFLEVKRYFEARIINRKDDPLLWWKKNGPQFPHVMEIARKYLAIPGSSVPSERLFSKAGELISSRSKLKPKNVDMVLFLNKNL